MLVLTKIHSLLRFPCVAGIVQTHIWPFATSWTATHQAPLSSTVSQGLFKFMSIESMMLSNHLIFYCSLLFSSSISTGIRVFPNELALLIRWPKYWSFSFSRSSCNECSGLISFRTDWFGLLAGFLAVFTWCPLSVPGSYPEYHITCRYHVSAGFALLWPFLRLFLFLMTSNVLRNSCQMFGHLSDAFFVIRLGLYALGGRS